MPDPSGAPKYDIYRTELGSAGLGSFSSFNLVNPVHVTIYSTLWGVNWGPQTWSIESGSTSDNDGSIPCYPSGGLPNAETLADAPIGWRSPKKNLKSRPMIPKMPPAIS